MNQRIYIELFSHLVVKQDDVEITRFRTQKTATLLAYLASHLNQIHPREELIELLWPDVDVDAGRTSLRTALASLRRQIEPPEAPENTVLVADRLAVRLNPEIVTTDVARFEAALQQARREQTAPGTAAQLSEAVALYRGPLLPGWSDAWIARERTRREQAFTGALRDLLAAQEALRDLDQAIQTALRLVAIDPLAEETHLALMRLYADTGQPAAVKRQFREWERIAREALGQQASPQAQALLHQLTSPAVALGPAARAAGVQAPLTPRIVDAPALRTSVLPQPTIAPGPPNRLPLQLTRFFGREDEIERLVGMLESGRTRLLTLTGPGGAGKTRLALEIAARLAPAYQNAVSFVSLAEVSGEDSLLEGIAKVLGLRPTADTDLMTQLLEVLNYRPALLVLDNFEQLPDEAAEDVQTLLEHADGLVCLVTSRRSLGIGGEQEYPVAPLPVPAASADPQELSQYASVQMFVDRARAVRPGFEIAANNAEAVAALCARLEGIPLAIELAAGWAQTQTPAQMLERLVRRFDLLTSRRKDLPLRHRTLRATLEWSYRLLTPELQKVFARLSVFRGGWTVEAAEAICADNEDTPETPDTDAQTGLPGIDPAAAYPGAPGISSAIPLTALAPRVVIRPEDILETLAQLRERSLVITEQSGERFRYDLLETLREYAQELVTDSDRQTLAQEHRDYFLAFAEEAESHVRGPHQAAWLDALEREHENLQAALRFCQEQGDSEFGLRLAVALTTFWHSRGYAREGLRWLETFLAHRNSVTLPTLAKALSAQATLQSLLGSFERVIDIYERSRRLFEQVGDKRGVAGVLQKMHSPVYFHYRDSGRAVALLEKSLTLSREIGDLEGIATSLASLGNMMRDQGDYPLAHSMYEQSLALYRQMGNTHGVSRVLADLGYMLTALREFPRAEQVLQESLALGRAINNKVSIGHVLWLLGRLKEIEGNYLDAAAYLEEGVQVARESGNQQQVFNATANLGIVASLQKDLRTALARYSECLAVAREMGNRWGVAYAGAMLGRLHLLRGDFAAAAVSSQQALAILRDGGPPVQILNCLETLARFAASTAQTAHAVQLLAASEAMRAALDAPLSPEERADYAACIDPLRAQMSGQLFAELWEEGRSSSLQSTIDLALALRTTSV